MLKFRPRNCMPSKCFEGMTRDDRVSQQISPHHVTPCVISVFFSTTNAEWNQWPGRLYTRMSWSSALRQNRVSSLKITRL
ncbi:hypothetical protein TNCV_4752681 [Trichonephila clavipes]|nr:hypothetical protein TNCV_4752681 [Trichonephila clavipes]